LIWLNYFFFACVNVTTKTKNENQKAVKSSYFFGLKLLLFDTMGNGSVKEEVYQTHNSIDEYNGKQPNSCTKTLFLQQGGILLLF
jgi:hypothetical protein